VPPFAPDASQGALAPEAVAHVLNVRAELTNLAPGCLAVTLALAGRALCKTVCLYAPVSRQPQFRCPRVRRTQDLS